MTTHHAHWFHTSIAMALGVTLVAANLWGLLYLRVSDVVLTLFLVFLIFCCLFVLWSPLRWYRRMFVALVAAVLAGPAVSELEAQLAYRGPVVELLLTVAGFVSYEAATPYVLGVVLLTLLGLDYLNRHSDPPEPPNRLVTVICAAFLLPVPSYATIQVIREQLCRTSAAIEVYSSDDGTEIAVHNPRHLTDVGVSYMTRQVQSLGSPPVKLTLSGTSTLSHDGWRALFQMPGLADVSISENANFTTRQLPLLAHVQSLRSLVLRHNISLSGGNVQNLRVSELEIFVADGSPLLDLSRLSHSNSLTELSLVHSSVPPFQIVSILDACELQVLNLANYALLLDPDERTDQMLYKIGKESSLTHLVLQNCNLESWLPPGILSLRHLDLRNATPLDNEDVRRALAGGSWKELEEIRFPRTTGRSFEASIRALGRDLTILPH